ncbi:MAG TPA: PIG-L family deacetylase [Polyangiales bacterium]
MSTSLRVEVRQRGGGALTLAGAFGGGPWLLIAPHDDDFILGAGLLVLAAQAHGIAVHVAVATDGSLGYARPEERASLVATRERELLAASRHLGLTAPQLHPLGFPDGGLVAHQGCRGPDQADSLGQRLVTLLRAVRPSSVFVCAPEDVHPDHRVCAAESEIACVWAASQIWLERGQPIPEPQRFHYAVYAPFAGPPDLRLTLDPGALGVKLGALRCFESQGVIDPMIERLKQAGPCEYFQRARVLQYRAEQYAPLFDA